ncbi:MAG: hypothetical protein IT270_06220 [Saprospiraceae bacterium]|nr:hypothetical protein [Saprospiraceae bacterium]
MKTPFHTILIVVGLLLQGSIPAATLHKPVVASKVFWLDPWLDSALVEYQILENTYSIQTAPLYLRLTELHTKLATTQKRAASKTVRLLLEERALEDSLKRMNDAFALKVVRMRYRKSLEIVKMLYEKILSMDHHFSSMLVQQELSNLSNPHHYPEFEEAREQIEQKVKHKYGFVLPNLLSGNPFLSASFSIIGMMVAGGDAKSKQERTDKMACVLDFTVRMYTDLNTIHFETGFLREANLALKRDCETLFADCAKQVGYHVPLEQCRNGDDWEKLYASLDSLVEQTQQGTGKLNSAVELQKIARVENNLQFAVDRVVQFISRYSNFVNAGNGYYKKFDHITSSYAAEQECRDVLPDPFLELRADIKQMLEKFDSAYRMPEMQGSKLKDLLYGVPE